MKLVTVAEMQTIEQEANAAGLTYSMMMENAGKGLADVVAERYSPHSQAGVLGLVGSGNNGGDTLVALTRLASLGWKTSAYLVRPRPTDDPLVAQLISGGGQVFQLSADPELVQLTLLVKEHAIILDGVLGTGTRLPLKPEVAVPLKCVTTLVGTLTNAPHVVAVDCPSGIDCDSGEAAPESIPAELTVTMAAIKQGMLKFPAFHLMGEIQWVGIGLPEGGAGVSSWQQVQRLVPDAAWVAANLPARPIDAHKGTFGTALVVAGSVNYTGAALLAGEAAYRCGAGLVTMAVPAPLHAALAGFLPEATWLLLPHELGVIAAGAADVLRSSIKGASALLLGPGFGLEDTTRAFIEKFLEVNIKPAKAGMGFVPTAAQANSKEASPIPPMVIDADGLKLLARLPDWPSRLPAQAILTPHPGEMSVLTGLSKDEVQADRLEAAARFSKKWGHIVVLKGALTVVAAPDGKIAVIPVASSALARAGTGDVLAGLITGLRAQGMPAFQAAVTGAWLHAQAGLMAAQAIGNTASVLAGDVLKSIPDVITGLIA